MSIGSRSACDALSILIGMHHLQRLRSSHEFVMMPTRSIGGGTSSASSAYHAWCCGIVISSYAAAVHLQCIHG